MTVVKGYRGVSVFVSDRNEGAIYDSGVGRRNRIAERRATAKRLRREGKGVTAISRLLNISISTVRDDLRSPDPQPESDRLVVGIDPGITTGIARLRADKSGITATVLDSAHLLARDLLVGLLDHDLTTLLTGASLVIVEETPVPTAGKMNRQLDAVIRYLSSFVESSGIDIEYVRPGVWKTSDIGQKKRQLLFSDWRPDTRHEEDAARIGLFGYRRGRHEES